MAELVLSEHTINQFAHALCAALDAGSESRLELYSARSNGTRLATLRFARPCAASVEGATIVFAPLAEEPEAPAAGKAVWAVARNGNGQVIFECDVGEEGARRTAVVQLDVSAIRAGDRVVLKKFTLQLRQG